MLGFGVRGVMKPSGLGTGGEAGRPKARQPRWPGRPAPWVSASPRRAPVVGSVPGQGTGEPQPMGALPLGAAGPSRPRSRPREERREAAGQRRDAATRGQPAAVSVPLPPPTSAPERPNRPSAPDPRASGEWGAPRPGGDGRLPGPGGASPGPSGCPAREPGGGRRADSAPPSTDPGRPPWTLVRDSASVCLSVRAVTPCGNTTLTREHDTLLRERGGGAEEGGSGGIL